MRVSSLLQRALVLLLCATSPTAAWAAVGETAPTLTVLVTHPRASVLQYYQTLVREHVLQLPGLHLVGIYHASETEDYRETEAYLAQSKVDWITLRRVNCPLTAADVFKDNACREEFRDLVEHSDGMIFNGGPDIPPALYGRPTELTTQIQTPHRHIFEVSLLFHLLGGSRNRAVMPLLAQRPAYAILGICVGMQSMNVAAGGTLVQDIPSDIYGVQTIEQAESTDPNTWHRSFINETDPEPGVAAGVFHPIRLTARAPAALRVVAGSLTPQVLSVHHQAIGRVADDMLVTATSLDGKVVEGIRHKLFANVIGWQFHPERPFLWDRHEVQRVAEGATDSNFGYTFLSRDSLSRAFNMSVWLLFAQTLRTTAGQSLPSNQPLLPAAAGQSSAKFSPPFDPASCPAPGTAPSGRPTCPTATPVPVVP